MKIEIELKRAILGQLIYVPTTDNCVGGLATVSQVAGEIVEVREVPGVQFSWKNLIENQVEYVRLYGGSKVKLTTMRRVG